MQSVLHLFDLVPGLLNYLYKNRWPSSALAAVAAFCRIIYPGYALLYFAVPRASCSSELSTLTHLC